MLTYTSVTLSHQISVSFSGKSSKTSLSKSLSSISFSVDFLEATDPDSEHLLPSLGGSMPQKPPSPKTQVKSKANEKIFKTFFIL